MSASEPVARPSPPVPAEPLKVLMICYEYPPLGGGTAAACSNLLSEMTRRDYIRIDLVTSGTSPRIELVDLAPRIRIHRLPVAKRDLHYWRPGELSGWTWRALPYARQLIRRRRCDVSHCWASWPSGVIGWHLRRQLPYIISLRGSDVPGYNRRLKWLDPIVFRPVVRRVWRGAAHVSANSRELRALAWRTLPDIPIDIIPNGVDAVQFAPGPRADRIDVLFAGRLIPRKAVINLLEAFASLGDAPRRPQLLIAGDGPDRGVLERRSRELGITERVVFLGHLDRARLARVYGEAGIFVLPSLAESLSNGVLEAMAGGLAIITTATGAQEVLRDNGLVVPPGDVAALRGALQRYLADPELLAGHQRRSRAIASGLSWTAVAEHFATVYDSVVNAPCRFGAATARVERVRSLGM